MKKGDRIEMIHMPGDHNPIPPGERGTVLGISSYDLGVGKWTQIDVEWDNGRCLSPVIPPDQVRILKEGD